MLKTNAIYLGDAHELIKQIPDKSIDCIYTDVPYLIDGGGQGNSKLGERLYKRNNELKDLKIFHGFDMSIYKDFQRVLKQLNLFIWCSKLQIIDTLNFFIDKHVIFDILTWNKTNPTPSTNNTWLPDIEYCIHIREKGIQLNGGYHLKSKWYTTSINKSDKVLYEHPTIKPYAFVKRHLEHATKNNDLILDPFLGSGTTAEVAKELNRNYIGFEIDETYYNIAKKRVNGINATGQTSIFTNFDSVENG